MPDQGPKVSQNSLLMGFGLLFTVIAIVGFSSLVILRSKGQTVETQPTEDSVGSQELATGPVVPMEQPEVTIPEGKCVDANNGDLTVVDCPSESASETAGIARTVRLRSK